jgi:hypothetical protein
MWFSIPVRTPQQQDPCPEEGRDDDINVTDQRDEKGAISTIAIESKR